jgi:hypothetical protein
MPDRLIVSSKERDAVLKLNASQRYAYFIKRVVDWQVAWGLWEDGWALVSDNQGHTGFPLWPAREFAEVCLAQEWAGYQPEQIALVDLINELLVRLGDDGLFVGVFQTPTDKGMLLPPDKLAASLRAECQKYI